MRRRGSAARIEIGAVIADRRIDAIAGEGGMGIVYRAWNLRLRRTEAVKVIGEEFVRDKAFRERFERETVIAASIEHPHVVTLYDSGEGPGGELFIAMRYVEGTNLDRLIRERGKLEPLLAAELIAQVGEALDAAHAQGLIHRDVKPANILIAGEEESPHAYLTDFGLAKRSSSNSGLTGVGLMVGTVDYMAPEQAGAGAVDLRADIYALGATLFTALTGEVPYPRDGDMARLLAKLSEPPPRVSEVTSGVPKAFDEVLLRAMAEAPDDRYPSAGELATAALDATGRRASYTARQRRLRGATAEPIGVGSVIDDRYAIEAEAGSGGMAIVYRATHLKLAKTVALKVMSPSLAGDADFRRRFAEEARSASEIDHDHVIPVYDFGEDEHGLYIVMRFVEQNLRQILRERGRLDPLQAVQIIEQVASALDAAHAQGLLHRDIKPANILVEEASSRIFLADFGLVRPSDDEQRQATESVLGTEWYMAPERRHREETKLGDIYSLGCVLWEMLVGSIGPLPGRSAHEEETDVPAALRVVVERAVSERPRERFASAGDLARAARDALASLAEAPEVRRGDSLVFQDPLSAGLVMRVLELCSETLAASTVQAAREELEAIRRRLKEPLKLAVAGRVGAGKSTLVNALVGRRVAQSSAGERAGIVTWYRHGEPERLEIILSSGERRVREIAADGQLPDTLDVPASEIAAVEVWLSDESLQELTIVDLPGVDVLSDTGGELPGQDEEQALALHRADAILFAMAGDAVSAEREALRAFRRRFEGSGRASAVNAIGVLAKADLADPDEASWRPALLRASRLREALGSLVGTVVPVATRIAQAANLGELTDQDVEALLVWAQLGLGTRERLLVGPAAGDGPDGGLPRAERERLRAILGHYGIRLALELADSGDPFSLVSVNRRLREQCGIDDLRKQISGLQLRADALKADAALTELESVSWRYGLEGLRDEIDRVRIDAPVLELVRLFDECASGEVELGTGKLEELECLLTGRTLADRLGLEPDATARQVRAKATQRAREWKTWAVGGLASFQGQQVANKVDDVYMQIAFPD